MQQLLCVNSLIRKTLRCGSFPLFLLILVGKYFIDFFFSSNRSRQSWEGLCAGLDTAGGFSVGRGAGEAVFIYMSVCGYDVLSPSITLILTF